MPYSVTCRCGRSVSVTAADAGSKVSCMCGGRVSVPPLSDLRRSAGRGAYETGTVDRINRMIRAGDLPAGNLCLICEHPTEETYHAHVTCESAWVKNDHRESPFFTAVLWILAPMTLLFRNLVDPTAGDSEPEVVGRNRGVDAPFPAHAECVNRLGASDAKLRRALKRIPEYEALFAEFPDAEVSARTMRPMV